MKKIISIVLTAVCAAALFAGCSAKAPEAAAEDGNVSLDGSTSMEKVIGSLGESFIEQQPRHLIYIQSYRLRLRHQGCI